MSGRTVARHTYSPTLQDEPESGVHRVAERVGPESGPAHDAPATADAAVTEEQSARWALYGALTLLARACARLDRSAK
jgi:hypothetical protein